MVKYVVRRILYMILVLVILSMIMFFLYNLIPYDRAANAARAEVANNKTVKLDYDTVYLKYQRLYGTDGSTMDRYLRWVGVKPYYNGEKKGILQGYMGYSITYAKDVTEVISTPMRNTVRINLIDRKSVV